MGVGAERGKNRAVNQKHILKLLDHLDARMREVEKQDDRQEECIAQMQEIVMSLIESVRRVEEVSTLKSRDMTISGGV